MSISKRRSTFPPPRDSPSDAKCTLQATGRGSEGWLLLGDETLLPLSPNSIKHSGRDGSDYGERGRE